MQNKKYKLLIFDWDGTLSNSLEYIVVAMQAAINDAKLPGRTMEQILAIIGLGLAEAAAVLYPELNQSEHDRLIENYRIHYLQLTAEPVPLFSGAEEIISRLHAQDYYLAVATGKSRKGLNRALQQTELGEYFHVTRCADETFSKPHPQMLLEIMDIVGISCDETIMIGDSEHDLQMAINANVASIAANYGAQSSQRLLEFNPVTSLQHLTDLTVWLEQ